MKQCSLQTCIYFVTCNQIIQLDVGELFLENGASVLARNKKGLLPVHCCAIQG